jgi:hypothetical protein
MIKQTSIKNWLLPILAALLGLSIAFGIVGPMTNAYGAPLFVPHSNHITDQTGEITLALDGGVVVMFHGKEWFDPKNNAVQWDACGNSVPWRYMNFGIMVRPDFLVTNVADGGTYKTHGTWKFSGTQQYIPGNQMCGDLWSHVFSDRIEIVTPNRTMYVTGEFYIEVDLSTGNLLAFEIDNLFLH